MGKTYKIGTVETLRVNCTGRRFYVNLDRDTVIAFGIQIGDRLVVAIKEGIRPDNSEMQHLLKTVALPGREEEGEEEVRILE